MNSEGAFKPIIYLCGYVPGSNLSKPEEKYRKDYPRVTVSPTFLTVNKIGQNFIYNRSFHSIIVRDMLEISGLNNIRLRYSKYKIICM